MLCRCNTKEWHTHTHTQWQEIMCLGADGNYRKWQKKGKCTTDKYVYIKTGEMNEKLCTIVC